MTVGKFGMPETAFANKRLCVTGQIKAYRGLPEIELHDPAQITVSP